jgi:hypothetical protein
MKRIAMVMILTCTLGALGRVAPIGTHWGHASAADDDGGDSGESGDDSDGT